MFEMTAQEIAEMADGELYGPGDVIIRGVRPLEEAGETDLAFVAKESLSEKAARCRAAALITPRVIEGYSGTQILCGDPELAVSQVLGRIHEELFSRRPGISESACIDAGATLGQRVSVGSHAVIEGGAVIGDDVTIYPLVYIGRRSRIGPRTTLHPHVTICDEVEIGSDCSVDANCVIGGGGFRYVQRDGRSIELRHVGGVRVGDGVDVRVLSSIDRGMLQNTVVGDGVKIAQHCEIAHNCRIGDHCVLSGYVRLAGSVTLGKGVMLAADVAIVDHVHVGDGAVLAAGSAVIADVKPGERLLGAPARPMMEQIRIVALEGRLPEMYRRLRELEEEVESLKKHLGETA